MTVPAKIPADTHVGNGVTTQFAYSFLCFDKVDFKVFIDLVLVDPSEYTVDGLGNPNGGMVTFTTPPANGVSVILRLDVVLDRQTNYQYEGDFLSPVVNRDFDRLWLSQQSQQVDLNAAVRFPPGESVSFLPAVNTRKGKALVFDPVTGAPKPSLDDYDDQAANAAASAAAADQAKQDAQTAAGNSSAAANAAAQSAIDAANAAASVDPQGLSTDHYGPTAPSTTWPGMTWADSGTNTLWRRNAADDAWVIEGDLFAAPVYPDAAQWLGGRIGEEFPLHPNAPLPPTDNPSFRYVILTAGLDGSGDYNEGVLTDETVTGSDPTITATAVVSLVGSPMDGQTIDLINTSRVFLRPGPAAGPIVDSQNLSHSHGKGAIPYGAYQSGGGAYSYMSPTSTDPSGGDEARPRYIPRVYLMRIL
ncbi:hypothetical protein [Castellaniella ginsengisoli]|uniref:Phage tail collar domain-containing protein n=1 Tax=Castellaniella ginsengisoli TaxID=546114 RepID=A0AB39DKK0_9BURK